MSPLPNPRRCVTCTVCCTAIAVPEMGKPSGSLCIHAKSKEGCRIYAERPASCVGFACAWLQGAYSSGSRPDKSGIVVVVTVSHFPKSYDTAEQAAEYIEIPTFLVHPAWEGGENTEQARRQIRRMMPRGLVMLITATEARILGGPTAYVELAEQAFHVATGGQSRISIKMDQRAALLRQQRQVKIREFVASAHVTLEQ